MSETTATTASELVRDCPFPPRILTVYRPASPVAARSTLKVAEVAEGMAVPSLNHWKVSGDTPAASTDKASRLPMAVETDSG